MCVRGVGNHFHLLLEVPDKEMALQGWSEDDFIKRLKVLKSEWTTKHTLDEVERWRKIGAKASVGDVAESVRGRLFDLSMWEVTQLRFRERSPRKGS